MQNIERKKVMEHIGMKLTEEHVRWAALGGSILGGCAVQPAGINPVGSD